MPLVLKEKNYCNDTDVNIKKIKGYYCNMYADDIY